MVIKPHDTPVEQVSWMSKAKFRKKQSFSRKLSKVGGKLEVGLSSKPLAQATYFPLYLHGPLLMSVLLCKFTTAEAVNVLNITTTNSVPT